MNEFIIQIDVLFQVKAFCDVDEKKLAKGVYIYEESKVNLNSFTN